MTRLHELRRGHLRFDVHDDGPPNGPAVVLLHGFPQDGTSWDRVLPLLHAGGLRTLVLDQRGYSPGARPRSRAAYRLDHLTADVLALLDAAGLPDAHLVGHDWGGGVVWSAAATAPDRVRSATIVSTPHPRAIRAAMLRSDQARRSSYGLFFQLPLLPEAVLRRRLPHALQRTGLPSHDALRYTDRARQPGALRAKLNWYRAIPLSRTPVTDVRVPTTLVWGKDDAFLGRHAAEATREHVHAPYRFVEVDGGHWLPETHPGAVAEAVLERVDDPAAT
ncbi:alpha/beta fold hydrolase [Georgenia sp. 10Sc9-8]|uniref:Alpha/beta fold hydrolase n=1 Tax=Georgenia halotolerans TaxID=3028317 RepID=A0ABT5U097_9MICO|nr:alpha/beta fold hydrolase [Georgenia halotolerans]